MSIRTASPQYRVVSYVPNPFAGDRVTVGAVVRMPDGSLHPVEAPSVPSARCVGGAQQRASFVIARKLLHKICNFDELPRVFGPQVLLSGAVDIPSDDPVAFVNEILFGTASEDQSPTQRPRHRKSYGREYFDSKGISKEIVRDTYRPPEDSLAPIITHYVASGGTPKILMEPLTPNRGRQVEEDIREVYARFNAYRNILGPDGPAMIAYLLYGFEDELTVEMREGLAKVAEVVNTSDTTQEQHFLTRIRLVAER